jgi:ribonuclease BN (tRNA processing enzyme)
LTTSVKFLGTGDAFNARGQCHACHLIHSNGKRILLDCGPTSLLALKREGLHAEAIDAILLSHLHGDHFAGLPFLLLACIYDTPRTRPLHVLGPPGTEARVAELYRAIYRDVSQRPLPFPVIYTESDGSRPVRCDGFEVAPFAVPHQENEISLGLRVAIDGKTILYSGDTGWTDALVDQSQGADVFICECCFFETRVDFHLDYPRIAEHRRDFGCKRLILSHIGREVAQRRGEIEEEISADGLEIEV